MLNPRKAVVINSKGGVGKTTTTVCVAAAAASSGQRVLVADLDPQANATEWLTGKKTDQIYSGAMFDLLTNPEKADLSKCILPASDKWPNTFVIPSNAELTTAIPILSSRVGFEKVLASQLARVEQNFGLIMMDTGPQLTPLHQLAIRAADTVIIPSDTSKLSESGVEKVLEILDLFKHERNFTIENIHIILTAQTKEHAKSNIFAKETLERNYSDYFLPFRIPHTVKVNDSQREDPPVPPINLVKEDHSLHVGYHQLTETIIEGRAQ